MLKNKIKKLISIVLTLSLIGTAIPCSAENIVPTNDTLAACASISTNYSKTNIDSKNSAHNLSVQAMNSKSDGIISSQKSKANLKDNPSGPCGDGVDWTFNTNTGELYIWGTGTITGGNWDKDKIKSVVIENDITGIEEKVFESCSNLESVIIGKKVISIGNRAFGDCSTLSQVYYLGASNAGGSSNNAFEGCDKLERVTVITSYYGDKFCDKLVSNCLTTDSCGETAYWILDGGKLTIYGTGHIDNQPTTYLSRNSIKSVVIIGKNISCIGSNVFEGCSKLESITIPDTVTIIGSFAFSGCSKLESITIPDTVTFIGSNAFFGCNSLGSIEVEEGNQNYASVDGVLFDKNIKTLIKYPANKKDGGSYKIPNTVTSIRESAFMGCSNLESITIPDTVTSIGPSAFSGCSNLSQVYYLATSNIGNSNNICETVFEGCGKLDHVTVHKNYIGDYFCGKTVSKYLTTDSCGNNAKWILNEDTGVLTIYGTGEIASDNYWDKGSIKSVVIENGITSIQDAVFLGCSALKSVTIPESIQSIGNDVFRGCSALQSITIPNTVKSIGAGAFRNCIALESITIPNTAVTIDKDAFSGCSKLETVDLGGTSCIERFAFEGCSALKSITIPASVESIDVGAFCNCNNLTSIEVNDDNQNYASVDGVLFKKNNDGKNATLIQYPAGKTNISYEIPNTVTSIEIYAFSGCNTLQLITFPASTSVTSIGEGAFYGCSALQSITIPSTVSSIGGGAFSGCSSLTSIEVNILNQNYASDHGVLFNKNKTSLIQYPAKKDDDSYEIPNTVTSIEDAAFEGCSSLESIEVDDNNQNYASVDGVLFKKNEDGTTTLIQCPANRAGDSYEIPNNVNVNSIGPYAFSSCSNLAKITIPGTVTSIGGGAFYGCSSLKSIEVNKLNPIYASDHGVLLLKKNDDGKKTLIQYPAKKDGNSYTIPDNVNSIVDYAFSGCKALSQIYYLATSNIGSSNNAFEGCDKLDHVTVHKKYVGDYFCGKTVSKLLTTGNCGDNAKWILNEDTGVLTIYGTGEITVGNWNKDSIKSVVIENGITSIGDSTFEGCSKLESITIPASVTCIGGNAFSGCSSLGSIEVNDNNLDYASADGVLFKKNEDGTTTLIQYPAKKSGNSYKIPNTVTSIKDAAFEGCSNLSSVTLGNKITSIGNEVFKNCSALVNIEIPKTVKSIESYAFSGCNALKKVTVAGDLDSVGKEAFSNCPKLSKFEYKGNYAPGYDGTVFDKYGSLDKISVSKNYQGEYKFCGYPTNFQPSFWNTDAGTGSAWFIGVTAFVFALIIAVIPAIKKRLKEGEPDKRYSPVNAEPDDPSVRSWAEFSALGAELSAFIKEVREALSSPKGLSPSPASKDTSSSGASSTSPASKDTSSSGASSPSPASKDTSSSGASSTSTAREDTSSPEASSTGGSDL